VHIAIAQNRQSGQPLKSTLQSRSRLQSLDVLRGLTVAFMILINNAGDGAVSYAQLRHSVWNGCTLTDVVFPLFLFIVGASITLSFGARLDRGVPRRTILLQVGKRSLLIFAVGLLLNALPYFHLSDLRYYGVMQRIALCYALASVIFLAGRLAASAAACVAALAGYWWLLLHVPVPGIGLPGVAVGILDHYGNLAAWLDRLLVPPAWQNGDSNDKDLRAFYEFNSMHMEPWDGPAGIVLTDGRYAACILDRNGLRPARWVLTRDNILTIASEVGVWDYRPEDVVRKGRVKPGQLFAADLHTGELLLPEEIDAQLKSAKPYRQWIKDNAKYLELSIDDDSTLEPMPKEELTPRYWLL